jgi:AcrR family transcriptional regulator
METGVAQGVRARTRAALTAEIKAAAKRQVAESGAASLSLRAVARELGMVSSAVYRYYPSRDELLTALIVDAYNDVGAVAEVAAAGSAPFLGRWLAMARAIRGWARTYPHDYALVYGSPVPGYRAPEATVPAAARVALVALGLLEDGVVAGDVRSEASAGLPGPVRDDLDGIRQAAAPHVPDDVLARGLGAWAQLFGTITLELFGHMHNVIHDYDAYFDVQMREAAARVAS